MAKNIVKMYLELYQILKMFDNPSLKNINMKTSFLTLFLILLLTSLSSCKDKSKFDGLILTDENTGKKYLLKHNIGDTYMIDEQIIQISGKDTTLIFK